MINLQHLRELYAATAPRATPPYRKLTNADLEGVELPITAWEESTCLNDTGDLVEVTNAFVSPITITRFGISPGCSLPSIDFTSRGERCTGSADLFYPTREDAQAAADEVLEGARQSDAEAALGAELRSVLPALLELVDMAQHASALLREFDATIANALQGDHPDAEEVRGWLERYETLTRSGEHHEELQR